MTQKKILNHAQLFDTMKALNFFPNPHEQVETFLQDMSAGENWYGNSVVEVKIFRDLQGNDTLVNHRGIIHPMITQVFTAA